MAQIIKHRRGTLAELNGVTLNNGELGIVTSSVASIGDAVLKTAIVVGNTDGTNRLSIGRIIKGNATPNLSGITGGAAFNDMLYHETDAKTLKVLNTGGNTSLDLTGNIADGEIGGTLTTTGNLSVQAHISASGNVTGSDVYASSGFYGDGSNITGLTSAAIDTVAAMTNNYVMTATAATAVTGEANLQFDGSTLTVTGDIEVSSHITGSANISSSLASTGSFGRVEATSFSGDGSNLTGVAQYIDTLSSYGASTIHQTEDEFLISDDGT